jgi:hypothetical protein
LWRCSHFSFVFQKFSQRFPFPEFSGEEIAKIIASLKAEGLASLGGLPAGIWDRNRLEQKYTLPVETTLYKHCSCEEVKLSKSDLTSLLSNMN